MSAPTDEFSKLRLEGKDMASRRSIAQQERRRRENEQRRRDSQALHIQQNSNVRPSTTRTTSLPGPTTLFESYTGIRYNASSMPQSTYRKAMTAMGSQLYCVNRAMRHQDQNGTYVAFQLQKSESVRIYDRSTESVPPAACSCQDFAEHRICSHIYWLYNSLNDVFVPEAHSHVQELTIPHITNRLVALTPQMAERLSVLPDTMNLRRDEAADAESDDDSEETMVIQDMLSVLDESRLPDDFDDPDFIGKIPKFDRSYQRLVTPGDIHASIFALARHDAVFRDRLRNALPKEMCASNFIWKLGKRAQRCFVKYDQYVSNGPRIAPKFIVGCANSLHDILETVADYQDSHGPTSYQFNQQAAELVVRALTSVTERDRDIYASSPWMRDQTPPSDPRNRNLFTSLLRATRPVSSGGTVAQELFGLDLLDRIPSSAYTHLQEPMKQLLQRLQAKNIPAPFVAKLRDLLDFEAGGSPRPVPVDAASRRPTISTLISQETPVSMQRASSLSRRPEVQEPRQPQRRRLD